MGSDRFAKFATAVVFTGLTLAAIYGICVTAKIPFLLAMGCIGGVLIFRGFFNFPVDDE